MTEMLEMLWERYLDRFNARWKDAEAEWFDNYFEPEAVIHYDGDEFQRIQFGMAEEHIAAEQCVNLSDWR